MRPKMQFSNPFLCKKLLLFSLYCIIVCAQFKSGNDYKSPCQRNAHIIDLWFWEKSKQNHQVLRTEKLDATTSKLVKLFLLRKYLQRPNLKFTHPASTGTKLHHWSIMLSYHHEGVSWVDVAKFDHVLKLSAVQRCIMSWLKWRASPFGRIQHQVSLLDSFTNFILIFFYIFVRLQPQVYMLGFFYKFCIN